MKSYINIFRNYANFSGFLKRKSFWTAMVIHLLILLIPLVPGVFYLLNKSALLPGALDLAAAGSTISRIYLPWVLPIWCFYYLLTRIPVLSACVRRLHTLPRRGWWVLIGLIPVAGWFILLIWLLQKGNYEDLTRRLQQAGMSRNIADIFSQAMKNNAERPKNGRWFFVVFALLAVGGFFLNRQIRKSGSAEAALASIRAALPSSWSDLQFGKEKDGKPSAESTAEPDVSETGEPTSEPDTSSVTLLRPIEGVPIMPRKLHEEDSLGADNYLYLQYGYGLFPAGEGVLASRQVVSVSAYRDCVDEGVCELPAELNTLAYRNMITEKGQVTDSDHNAGGLPMVYVTREQAAAFCEWAGMRLPTADEWREAAKTSAVETWMPENANCVGTDRSEFIKTKDQLALTVPVAAFRDYASDYGMIQMAGNVWEWVTSEEEPDGTALALGGAWNSYPANIGPDAELQTLASYSADNIGFRCFVDESALTTEFFWGGEQVTEIEAEDITDEAADKVDAEDIEAEVIEAEVIEAEEIEADKAEEASIEANDAGTGENESEINADDSAVSETAASAQSDDSQTTVSLVGSFSEELFRKAEKTSEPDEDSSAAAENADLVRPQDHAEMIYIPAAAFNMGIANGGIDEKPVHEVSQSAYWIDAYEITNEQYALCVAEGICTEPHETKSFRQSSYYGNPDFDQYPVIYVDWQQAADYCAWTGSQLPTEAQWEYAAKGPDNNQYPWGNAFDSQKLNYSGNGNYDTLAVDATPEDVSYFGVYNLGGNVSEWVYDRYQENWYSVTDQPADPSGPEVGQFRVIRGASVQTGENNARTADRFYAKAETSNMDRGFRCARWDK